MKVIPFLLDLLYPPRCAFCHDFLETSREGICAHCRTGLPFAQYCGRQHLPFIPACVSPLNYEGNVRESLLRYKFGGATGYAKVYGRLVAETVRTELPGAYDLITWVPLSRKRLRERGYDQARLLAKATACRSRRHSISSATRSRSPAPATLPSAARTLPGLTA